MENQSYTNDGIRSFRLSLDELNSMMKDPSDSDAKAADYWYGRVDDKNDEIGPTTARLLTPYGAFREVYDSMIEYGRFLDAGCTLFPECLRQMHKS